MTPEQFAYWLNGFFENVNAKTLNESQVNAIRSHLELVFDKVADSVDESEPNNVLKKAVDEYSKIFPTVPVYPQPNDYPLAPPLWCDMYSDKPVC